VRAENDIGCEALDLRVEFARIELFCGALQFADERVAAWTIGFRIQVGPELRKFFHEPDVLLTIELPEVLRHEREQIEVSRDERRLRVRGCFDDGVCGAYMAGAGGYRQNQQATRAQKFSGCLAMRAEYIALIFGRSAAASPVAVNGAMIRTSRFA